MKRDIPVGVIVDRLGTVKAKQSDLGNEAEALKAVLIELASGNPNTIDHMFSGNDFRAVVTFVNRTVTDWREVEQRLLKAGVEAAVIEKAIKQSTKLAEGVPTVRVSARRH